jgi:hypothetical protein
MRFTRLLIAVLSSDKLAGGFNWSSAADRTWSTKVYGSHVVDAVFDDPWAICLSDYIIILSKMKVIKYVPINAYLHHESVSVVYRIYDIPVS